ncbi:pyrimidine 5'-nucleotidase [Brevundimonas sp.]|uniref:pyrimidine 5'-nucleotidase n=1 Tax=Brevundimonas sp. TaxID=1871086 RepID=UPI00289B315B|nr:pyrimidine 5'-nucleotidase [Brevundimonas sp.]
MTDPHSASLGHVRAWVFDMDDTLYPCEQGLMRLVQARINAFVVEAVGLEPEAAAAMQRQFLDEHGTTLAGLMANYAVDTERFLHEVHDVPLDGVEPNPRLAERLKILPGRSYVFTNGARDYAHRVLERIGVADCFAGVFAIEDGDLTPKPNPATFRRMLERFDIDPHQAAFFEDTPKNLEPAKALGMVTVLIGDGHGKPLGDHIDHVAPDLLDFLSDLTFKDAA